MSADRTREIEHAGKKIVHLDFSDLTDPKAALAAIEQARTFVAKYPPSSVLTLTDCSRSRASEEVVAGLKSLSKANKPYVKAGAVVGLTALQRVLFRAVMTFAGRNMTAFDSLEQAKEWLARQ